MAASLLVIGLIVVLIVVGGSRNRTQETVGVEEDYVPVEIETISKDTIANTSALNGRIYANEEVMVMPQMPGIVSRVNVKLGDYVTKDQVLFVMDQKDVNRGIEQAGHSVDLAERGVDQAENAMKSAEIQYQSTKERHEDALSTLERMRALYEAGAVPKTQLEQAELAASTTQLDAAEAQVKQAEIGYQQALNQLSQAQSGYEQAKSNLDNTLVKAPVSGVVTSLTVVEGQLASNAQPAATIVDMDEVYLQVNVAENMVNRLQKQQEVSVSIPSALSEDVVGTIDYISPAVDQRTQLYLVKVYIPNQDHVIKPGMSGAMSVDTESRQDVLVVRRSAVLDRDREMIVYLVEEDKAVERRVTLGLDIGLYVEVVEGLEEGDVVITRGQHYVADGQMVKVVRGE